MRRIGNHVRFEGEVIGTIDKIASVPQNLGAHGTREWRIERIQRTDGSESLLRICYYKDGKWANRPPTLHRDVFVKLLDEAKKQGII